MDEIFVGKRLNQALELNFTQDDVGFAIPFLEKDIPLFIDPFLLWSSQESHYHQLHDQLMYFFENVRYFVKQDRDQDAMRMLSGCSEPLELGLGYSTKSKRGSTIGKKLVQDIITMYKLIPQITENGLNHVEEIQLVVPKISRDRLSDITYSVLKEFFIQYTILQSEKHDIPTRKTMISNIYDIKRNIWVEGCQESLPFNPTDNSPIVLAPLNLLRHLPWINYTDYYNSFFAKFVLPPDKAKEKFGKIVDLDKDTFLNLNRQNFQRVRAYIKMKENDAEGCRPTPYSERTILEEAVRKASQCVMILEKQIAKWQSSLVPTHLLIDLKDKKQELSKLEEQLESIKKKKAST